MKQGEGFEPAYPGQGPPPGQWGSQQWGSNYPPQPGYGQQYPAQQMSHGPPGGPGQYQQPGYGYGR
ncbi:hypothetical protein FRC02_011992 [Tulasnella sp. 418]|nr:hypothetical protein FRC02_011992 [Tulasnella sp. 418]